nr:molecular chaperone HtpG [uncultured Romboutsia sp.]
MTNQKGNISIHTENIFPIIKKWLYSDKDIFIRELISNGCDAVNKYKKLISLGEAQGNADENYKIKVSIDKENSALIFEDNGIGMTAEEVEKYINQVAFSGAEDFFNTYKEKINEENDIIGHFGLGFYSSFMVSKKVQIDTLSYKENATPVRWVSEDGLEFELSESDSRNTRGTTITLFLADDSKEFLEEYTVRNIIDKYCSFLPVDIYLETIKTEEVKEDEVVDTTPINDKNPLWLKAPKDCTDEEYKEFYRKVFKTFDEPLFWIHLNVDYPFNLKGILYFPKLKNEFELIEGKVKLYNNQVFVADNIKEVIPEFLLLLKGVIDCPDLPLNVSRSFLQNDRDVSKISKHIVKKVADKLKSLYKNERENYEKFWDDIQVFIKFGCLKDESFYDKVKDSILFKTINSQYITLNDYLENCKEKHENKVFYVSNEEQQSQYIKLFKDYELDAVILDSTIDNHFISMIEFKNQGVRFNRIDADLSDILKDNDNEDNKEIKTDIENLFKDVIGDRIKTYSVESLKSEDTPAIILISEQSRRMAEMRSQFAGMDFGMSFEEEKTLVINGNSSIVKKLVSLKDDESKKEQVSLICNQIVDIALLSNKELDSKQLDEFIKRNNQLMSMVISL